MSNGMDQAIKDFAKQFSYQPQLEGDFDNSRFQKFIVCGMGGSHLAANILKTVEPQLDLVIHSDYGLPTADLAGRLVIAMSYSGNTEEVIESFNQALEYQLPLITIAVGGRLLELAKANGVPYIQLPNTGIQPRSALGFMFLALLKAMGQEDSLNQASKLVHILKPADLEPAGRGLAEKFAGSVPIIYASNRNWSVAYNWKIKLNETGKIPAFYNVLPEMNHNEMIGFDVKDSSQELSEKFYFVFLRDPDDHPQIKKRFKVLESLYQNRGLRVEAIDLAGETVLEKIFSSLLLADWFAFYTAQNYGLESELVPMVEEFKKLIQ